jgi:D-amino peptidase
MNLLISVDMEGISGVVNWDHVSSNHKEYDRFRKLMTAEANAAIEGALSGGATQVVVNDSHGGMANILIEELNPAAELISGSPKPFGMMQGIGPGGHEGGDTGAYLEQSHRVGGAPQR